MYCKHSVSSVQADDDGLRPMPFERACDERRVADCRRAQHDTRSTTCQGAVDGLVAPEASAELNADADGIDDRLYCVRIVRNARARAV